MRRALSIAVLVSATGLAVAQPCAPHWEPAPAAPNFGVHALAVQGTPSGTVLYVGGRFTAIGSVQANRIASYDGAVWSPLGSGIPGSFNSHGFQGCCANVHAINVEGDTVHIAGNFIEAGGVVVESIADYADGQWRSLSGGVESSGCVDCAFVVYAMTRFGDPGAGPLFAAGTFDLAGGVPASRIARWNGQTWAAVGSGIGSAPGDTFPSWITSLTSFGGQLYAAGSFSAAGSIATRDIARWSGTEWSDVGGGLGVPPGGRLPSISAMAVFDDGSGPALCIAGIIDLAGSIPVRNIARWNGSSWSALGPGVGSGVNDLVWALTVFDDGRGPALYVGGEFADAGGSPAANIARWNGHAWSPVGAGVDGAVQAFATLSTAAGPELYVGGWFLSAGGASSPYLARWVGCATCYANCDQSTVPPILNINDFACFANRFAAQSPDANCDGSTTPPTLNVNDFQCFVNRFAAGCG
jgi:hypothetical protein